MNGDRTLLQAWRDGDDPTVDTNALVRLLDTRLIAIDRVAGRVVLAFTPPRSMYGADGVLGLVAVAAMLDFACGFAAMPSLPLSRSIASSTLRIEQVGRARVPARDPSSDAASFEAEGVVVASNATTMFTRATLTAFGGGPIALATSTLRTAAA